MSLRGNPKWDRRYLGLAKTVSTWSKDTTKIGAVIVDNNHRLISQGYNGYPRGFEDCYDCDRETKLNNTIHAELNAILNASINGVPLADTSIYIYGLPVCHECAKAIIQCGIKRVVMSKETHNDRWNDSFEITKKLFNQCGVMHYEI